MVAAETAFGYIMFLGSEIIGMLHKPDEDKKVQVTGVLTAIIALFVWLFFVFGCVTLKQLHKIERRLHIDIDGDGKVGSVKSDASSDEVSMTEFKRDQTDESSITVEEPQSTRQDVEEAESVEE